MASCVFSDARNVMSLLSGVEQAIKSCKAEQAKINDSIQLYRELLHSLIPQPKTGSGEPECAEDAAADTAGEREDMELLERALEKALCVRTGTASSEKASGKQSASRKKPDISVTSRERIHASAALKGNQSKTRANYKSVSLDRKDHNKHGVPVSSTLGSRTSACHNPELCKTVINRNITRNSPVSSAGIVHHQAAGKSQRAASASDSLDRGQLHTSALHSKNKTIRSNVLSGNDLGNAATISTPLNNTVSVSQTQESRAHTLLQQNGSASDKAAKWKYLRSKLNRLWDKVVAVQRKPASGRSHFMEKMRAMFPKDWPCGCPDETRALVDRLTHQGHDLTQQCQMTELLARQTPEAATELDGKATKYDSYLTLERLQTTAAQLQHAAHQAEREWEAWDRWRPEGGCLCPSGVIGLWGDGMSTSLPLTITYTREAELRELEKLRMRVVLLQQDIHLEQALLDALSPQLSSIVPGPGCPSPSVLRDMYSLLAEGGERFPAIVLDSEHD